MFLDEFFELHRLDEQVEVKSLVGVGKVDAGFRFDPVDPVDECGAVDIQETRGRGVAHVLLEKDSERFEVIYLGGFVVLQDLLHSFRVVGLGGKPAKRIGDEFH